MPDKTEWNLNVIDTKTKPPLRSRCWECSEPIGTSAKICPNCGADQRKRPIHVPWWLLITLLAGVLAFIGFIAYAANRGNEWRKFKNEIRKEYGG